MDRTQIGINARMYGDSRGNFLTGLKVAATDMPKMVEECWHMKQEYYCEGLWKVPVPTTWEGKPVFFSAIVKIGKNIAPYVVLEVVNDQYVASMYTNDVDLFPAKFAELIVASKEFLIREGVSSYQDKMFEIVNYHGLPEMNVPPLPSEIAKNMRGKHSCFYHYSTSDIVESIEFWSQHLFVGKTWK